MTKRASFLQHLWRQSGPVRAAVVVAAVVGLGAAAVLSDPRWLLAVPALAGGAWLAARRRRRGHSERMTTDPWQVDEPPCAR
jgi:hypothetical protein